MPTVLWIGAIFIVIADITEMIDGLKQEDIQLIKIQEKYENKKKHKEG